MGQKRRQSMAALLFALSLICSEIERYKRIKTTLHPHAAPYRSRKNDPLQRRNKLCLPCKNKLTDTSLSGIITFDSLKALPGCSSVWLEHLLWEQGAAGSNPVTPICSADCQESIRLKHFLKNGMISLAIYRKPQSTEVRFEGAHRCMCL